MAPTVRRVVDLSVPLDATTQVYPGDPVVCTAPAARIATEGYNVLHVSMGSHTGTHLDAPYHFDDDGLRIDELDLSLMAGPAVVVDLPGLEPRERIGWSRVAPYADRLRRRNIAVLKTGWSSFWGTPAYFEHPYLDADSCRRLLDLGVRTLLVDTPNPDETPHESHPGCGFPVHHLIARAGGIIGENFTNLELLDFDPFMVCLPLRLAGADGAPVRAVATELGEELP